MGRKGFCKCSIKFKAVWIKSELHPRICLEIFKPRVGWKKKKKQRDIVLRPMCVQYGNQGTTHAVCPQAKASKWRLPGDSTRRWTLWSFTIAPRSFCILPVDTLRAPCEFLISLLSRWMATPYPSDTGCTHDPNWVTKVLGLQYMNLWFLSKE